LQIFQEFPLESRKQVQALNFFVFIIERLNKKVDKGKLLLVLTSIQWIDALRYGLLADGKYRAAVS